MKGAVYRTYGPPEVVQIEDLEAPTIRENDDEIVLVKVHSGAVNPYDYLFRSGYLPTRASNGWLKPKQHRLGIDVAGTVEMAGKRVNRFKVGDRVFGSCLGSHAEFVRARQTRLSLIPPNVTFAEAAAMPCVALTAVQALRDVAKVQPGQKVLVYGASGGIGHLAVQMAKHYKTDVTAVCSTANLGWVKDPGADRVIDYTREDFAKSGVKYDLILDAVGKRTFFNSRGALTKAGIYITEHVLYPRYHPLQLLLAKITADQCVKVHLAESNEADLDFIGALMAEGKVRPVIDKIYPLEQIVAAHRHVEGQHTKGKVVIEVRPA